MDTPFAYELIGYLASTLIVVSLLMTSVLRLRIIGLVGAICFTTYGVLIGAWPIAVANSAIICVQSFHLVRILRQRAAESYFDVLEIPATSPFLCRFVDFHLDDIRRFQPDFPGVRGDELALLVLRDALPTGALLAEVDGDEAKVVLDYVVPQHRDVRPGRFLWVESDAFTSRGIGRVTTTAPTAEHARYLAHVGFEPVGDGTWAWRAPHAAAVPRARS